MDESRLVGLAEALEREASRARAAALSLEDLRALGCEPDGVRRMLADLLRHPREGLRA